MDLNRCVILQGSVRDGDVSAREDDVANPRDTKVHVGVTFANSAYFTLLE